MILAAPVAEAAGPDYLDVDVIEEPVGALPAGDSAFIEQELAESDELTLNFEDPEADEENVDTAVYEVATDEYEGADDDSPGTDENRRPTTTSTSRIRRGWRRRRTAICGSRTR